MTTDTPDAAAPDIAGVLAAVQEALYLLSQRRVAARNRFNETVEAAVGQPAREVLSVVEDALAEHDAAHAEAATACLARIRDLIAQAGDA